MSILATIRRPRPPRAVRPLLIVARDRRDFYRVLRGYRDTDEFTVVLDRRQAERRRRVQPAARERRRGERRSLPARTDALRVQPYVLVSQPGAGALAPPCPRPCWRARVTRYLRDVGAWLRGTATDHQQPAPTGAGARPMPSEMARPAVARLTQWLDEGRTVLEKLQQRLHAYDQAVAAVRAAQAERDRLQQQGAALREEVQQLHAAVARLQKERTDAAHWFATMLQEAAVRFPATPPPA